jgi:catechol 2,3-dioxygenase-like lactoylglutathione lyase family enzyme
LPLELPQDFVRQRLIEIGRHFELASTKTKWTQLTWRSRHGPDFSQGLLVPYHKERLACFKEAQKITGVTLDITYADARHGVIIPEDRPLTLAKSETVAFVATTQPEKARAFYCDVLGLHFVEDSPFALVLKTANATLRIQKVQAFTPLPFTTLGWKVADVKGTAKNLRDKGVTFERFQGMSQDDLGIWDSPSGAKVCWFKDPDGNILSLTQFT